MYNIDNQYIKILNPMKFKLAALIVTLFSIIGCSPTMLFTKEQFVGFNSDLAIPEKWHGRWSYGEEKNKYYISNDTFSIGDLSYKILKPEMKIGDDSTNGKDKLIFKDDWCFLSKHVDLESEWGVWSGYWIFLANFDKNGNINCWEMSYDYFLKNQLIKMIPIVKYRLKNISEKQDYQKIEPNLVYVEIPDEYSKRDVKQLIKHAPITTEFPYFNEQSYDFDFFKKIALSRTPDIILTNSKNAIRRKMNANEIKFKKIAEKKSKENYIKLIKE